MPQFNQVYKDSTTLIRVVSGKEATSTQINCVYSTLSAYEALLNDEKLAPHRTILQKCNLNNYIEPNLIYDKARSVGELNDLLSGIPLASGMVMSGQRIVDRGDIVDEHTYRVLYSLEKEMKRRRDINDELSSTIVGQIIFVTILVLFFTIYLILFRRDYFDKPRSITMLYTLITLFPIIVSLMMEHNLFSVYIIPFAIAPIFTRVFMGVSPTITALSILILCSSSLLILFCTKNVLIQFSTLPYWRPYHLKKTCSGRNMHDTL